MTTSFEDLEWTYEVDVIVAGGGGGGMAAAISAARTDPDADVLVFQKINELGGSTTMSMGNFTAADTYKQRELGVDDSADSHFEDFSKLVDKFESGAGRYYYLEFDGDLKEKDNLELRRLHVERAGETLDWLHSLGCEYAGPYRDPPNSIPRTYQIQPDTKAYADVLGDRMEDLGVRTIFETEVYELIPDDRGRVGGVLAKERGQRKPILARARNGVVLACGDYINSPDLRDEYTTNLEIPAINDHNTGDGHKMARDAGAQLLNMDVQWFLLRLGDPTYLVPEIPKLVDEGAILVNGHGRRFVNERSDYDKLVKETLRQPDECCYILFDERVGSVFDEWPHYISTYGKEGKIWAFLDEYMKTDYGHSADSVSALATALTADSGVLEETLAQYNTGRADPATGQAIDPFGRESTQSLTDPPYYAIGPVRNYLTITDGGVAISTNMEVLDTAGEPIDGLYASGVMAGDHHLFGHGHHHSWIFTSGRIAGRAAANRRETR